MQNMEKPDNQGQRFKIVAIAGSLRKTSYTRFSLQLVLDEARKKGAETQMVDLREYNLPFCEGYENEEEFPDLVKYKKDLESADALIIGTPEYHGGYSGVIKNAIDLLDRNFFENRLVGLVGVAGGSLGATNSLNGLRQITRHLRAWTVPHHISVPSASKKFDKQGNCLEKGIEDRLRMLGQILVDYGKLHKEFDFPDM